MRLPKLRFRLIVAEEYQPLRVLGWKIWLLVLLCFGAQISFKVNSPVLSATASDLPEVPNNLYLEALALGDKPVLNKILTLWLQAFDNQQGVSISFKELDYNQVTAWLDAIISLDEKAQYPMFAASRVYTFIKDKPRVRIMLEFIHEKFLEDPANRWEWMSHAVTLAKNELEDIDLALKFARDLREHTVENEVPNWARQMETDLLEANSEYEDAIALILNLTSSGEITDPREFALFYRRLRDLLENMSEQGEVIKLAEIERLGERLETLCQTYLTSQIQEQLGRCIGPNYYLRLYLNILNSEKVTDRAEIEGMFARVQAILKTMGKEGYTLSEHELELVNQFQQKYQ